MDFINLKTATTFQLCLLFSNHDNATKPARHEMQLPSVSSTTFSIYPSGGPQNKLGIPQS
jgi:hypothetical protein